MTRYCIIRFVAAEYVHIERQRCSSACSLFAVLTLLINNLQRDPCLRWEPQVANNIYVIEPNRDRIIPLTKASTDQFTAVVVNVFISMQ